MKTNIKQKGLPKAFEVQKNTKLYFILEKLLGIDICSFQIMYLNLE